MFMRYLPCSALTLMLTVGLMSPAMSQDVPSPSELTSLFSCQSETDDTARLACFDQTVSKLRQAEQSGDIMALSRDDVEKVERDAFGFNLPSLPKLRGLLGLRKSESPSNDLVADQLEDKSSPKAQAKSETQAKPDDNAIKQVAMTVERWETFNRGRYRFYLTNGQVWQQIDSESIRRPRAGEDGNINVVITKASLGSFILRVNDKGRAMRVKRVR